MSIDPQPSTHELPLVDIIEPLFRAKFWMKLIGVLLILSGILVALTIVGLLFAWIPIWAGVMLMQAAGAAQRAYETHDSREARQSLVKLKTYFTIFGVVMLIQIFFVLIGFLMGGLTFLGMGGVSTP
ncbi:MAG: DUF5362 family protein [Thioalkalivibrionaceae bacterium]